MGLQPDLPTCFTISCFIQGGLQLRVHAHEPPAADALDVTAQEGDAAVVLHQQGQHGDTPEVGQEKRGRYESSSMYIH